MVIITRRRRLLVDDIVARPSPSFLSKHPRNQSFTYVFRLRSDVRYDFPVSVMRGDYGGDVHVKEREEYETRADYPSVPSPLQPRRDR